MPFQDRAFFLSVFLTVLADQVLLFLVPLVIFQATGDVGWSGLAFFVETLPRFIAFPVAGLLCDRYPAERLLSVSRLVRAGACMIGIFGQFMFGGVWWLVALSAVAGVMTSQGIMALEVVLVRAFPHVRFEKIASHSQMASQMGVVLGPLVAAYLLAVAPWEIVVVGATGVFLAADLSYRLWPGRARLKDMASSAVPSSLAAALGQGLRQVLVLPGLMRAILQASGVNLVVGATLATAAAMMTGLYGQSDQVYAWLHVGGAFATLAVLSFTAHVRLPLRSLGLIAYGLIVLGMAFTGFAGSPAVYAAGFLLIAGFDKMFNIYVRSLRKDLIPPADFGKTTGIVVCLNNLSQPLAGLIVALFANGDDARAVLFSIAVGAAVLGALTVFWIPKRG